MADDISKTRERLGRATAAGRWTPGRPHPVGPRLPEPPLTGRPGAAPGDGGEDGNLRPELPLPVEPPRWGDTDDPADRAPLPPRPVPAPPRPPARPALPPARPPARPGLPAPGAPARPTLPPSRPPGRPALPAAQVMNVISSDPRGLAAYLARTPDPLPTLAAPVPALDVPELVELVGAPLSPLPWDAHVYRWVPPPALPAADQVAWGLVKKLREVIERESGQQQLAAWDRLGLPSRQRGAAASALSALSTPTPAPPVWAASAAEVQALKLGGALSDAFEPIVVLDRPLLMLDAWLSAVGIRYFSAAELCRQKWRFPYNKQVIKGKSSWAYLYKEFRLDWFSLYMGLPLSEYAIPHPEDWPNILPVLIEMDRFRHWMRGAVTVISGYRSPSYNSKPPEGSGVANAGPEGAGDSRHMSFEAVDFIYRDRDPNNRQYIDPRPFYDFHNALYRNERDGIGVYSTFIHLDRGTRGPGSGKAARWDKRKDESTRAAFSVWSKRGNTTR